MIPEDWYSQLKKAYPKRSRGKNYNWPIAKKKILEIIESGEYSFDEILEGTQAFCKASRISGDYGTEFIPMASTFYNQLRFDDVFETEGPEMEARPNTVSREPTEAEREDERRKAEENIRRLTKMAEGVR